MAYAGGKANVESLLARFKAAKDRAYSWHELYADVYKYTQPFRNPYSFSQSNPQRITTYQSGDVQRESSGQELYDSTAVIGTHSLAAKLLSHLVPPYTQWQKFDAGPEIADVDKDQFLREAEKLTDLFFRFLNESNFYVAITEAFYDLIVGTAALYVTKGEGVEKPLNFQSVPIAQLYIEQSATGKIDTVFYERMRFRARDVQEMWPKGTLCPDTQRQLEQNPNLTIDLIEMTLPVEGKKGYRYVVLETNTKHCVVDSISESTPWIIFRWSKTPGDEWGTGPATHISSHVKTLNAIAEDELRSGAFKASPMWFAWSDGVFNPNNFVPQPGAVMVGSGLSSGNMPIRPIPVEGDTQFVQLLVQDLRDQINKALFVDKVRPNDASPLTATEVLHDKQVLLEQLQPGFSRLTREFLPKLTDRIIYILKDWGLFPDIKIDGKKIRLTYTSPLAKGQDNAEIQAFVEFAQMLQQVAGPQMALGAMNVAELPTWLAERVGVDMELVKSAGEIQENLEQAAQAAEQQEGQQQLPGAPQVPEQPAAQF